jgi:hypothetical protein
MPRRWCLHLHRWSAAPTTLRRHCLVVTVSLGRPSTKCFPSPHPALTKTLLVQATESSSSQIFTYQTKRNTAVHGLEACRQSGTLADCSNHPKETLLGDSSEIALPQYHGLSIPSSCTTRSWLRGLYCSIRDLQHSGPSPKRSCQPLLCSETLTGLGNRLTTC